MTAADLTFTVETQWLADHLEDDLLRIIDCHFHLAFTDQGEAILNNARPDWEKAHIPNSVYLDLLNELSDTRNPVPFMMPNWSDFSQTMSRFGIDQNSKVIIYDRGETVWATRLWWMLKSSGFDNATILNGGWPKWRAEKHPVASGNTASIPQTQFTVHPRPELFVDKQQVRESLDEKGVVRICGLDRPVFHRGHIPGSMNIPAKDLIDPADKTFLPLEELRKPFDQIGITPQDRIITYCGGGIAGSCVAFVLNMLGYQNVALYDGSMEEWRIDSSLPIEVTAS